MRSRYISSLAFIDILFNMLIGFVGLFVLAFLLINVPTEESNIKPKAEYLIITTWRDNSNNDVDTWVRTPSGTLFFRRRQVGFAHLDKDDLGNANDTVYLADGNRLTVPINREVVALRGFEKGEYIVNVHLYSASDEVPENVTVELLKVNPHAVLYRKDIKLHDVNEEATAVRFFMAEDGTIENVSDVSESVVDHELLRSLYSEDTVYGY